jgi:hypothetical protein
LIGEHGTPAAWNFADQRRGGMLREFRLEDRLQLLLVLRAQRRRREARVGDELGLARDRRTRNERGCRCRPPSRSSRPARGTPGTGALRGWAEPSFAGSRPVPKYSLVCSAATASDAPEHRHVDVLARAALLHARSTEAMA